MSTLTKKLVAFAITLALLACLGITALAAESSLPESSLQERVSPRAEVSTLQEKVSSRAEVSALQEKLTSKVDDGTVAEKSTKNPRTGIPAVLPVVLLGLAAGGTALIAGKERS